ncbi:MAG TPA: ribosome biogenesis GTP-binding protein YihA/YsxC [Xylella taiwanensis]
MSSPLECARYLLSAHTAYQLPTDDGGEVAFAGRSNAGKSSVLNTLTRQNALARVSKTPGRTQQLVYFTVTPQRYLVDLPGYGYAKVPKELQVHWQAFIDTYFRNRQALRGLVVVMDIRHPLKEYDLQMLSYATQRGLPAQALLTKADKLGRGQQAQALQKVHKELTKHFADHINVQIFSSKSRQGIEELHSVIETWLGLARPV